MILLKRLCKIKYGLEGSISNVDLSLCQPSNQLIFSFVTFWFFWNQDVFVGCSEINVSVMLGESVPRLTLCIQVDQMMGLNFQVNLGTCETLLSPYFHNTTVATVFNKYMIGKKMALSFIHKDIFMVLSVLTRK